MKKILFVEDDLVIIRIYRAKFQAEGYEVEVATDGQSALDCLKKSVPDLVVLDLQLPKVNGVEVLKFIRSQPRMRDLPVVVFTNAFLSELVQEAQEAGATKTLTKANCTPRQLLDVLRTTLANAAQAAGSNTDRIPATEALARLAQEASSWAASVMPPAAPTLVGNQSPSSKANPELRSNAQNLSINEPPHSLAEAADAQSQALIRKIFLDGCSSILTSLRGQLSTISRSSEFELMGQRTLAEMFRAVHSLTGNAGLAGFRSIARMASALEALLQELQDKPRNLNASSLRTLASAVDALGCLFQNAGDPSGESFFQTVSLVVDDDPICSQAVSSALKKANLKSISLNDPQLALQVAEKNRFDLIFLDVEMPGMNGLELAGKLRALETNGSTPITFVTTLSDFETRARSILSGGNDLIAKPFLLIELAVKALTYLLKPPPIAKPMAKAA